MIRLYTFLFWLGLTVSSFGILTSEQAFLDIVEGGDEKKLKAHLESNQVNMKVTGAKGLNPIGIALTKGNFKIVQLLLDHGAVPDAKTLELVKNKPEWKLYLQTIISTNALTDVDPVGAANLGRNFLIGQNGFPNDPKQAFKWLSLGAHGSNAAAQANLGFCYQQGLGTKKNDAEAFRWYMKSAKSGSSAGEFFVGECYAKGIGTPVDMTNAVSFYKLAAQGNYQLANQRLESLAINGDTLAKTVVLEMSASELPPPASTNTTAVAGGTNTVSASTNVVTQRSKESVKNILQSTPASNTTAPSKMETVKLIIKYTPYSILTVTVVLFLLIIASLITFLWGFFEIIIAAFKESVVWGLVALLVPLGKLIFLSTHWEQAKKGFFKILISIGLYALSIAMAFLLSSMIGVPMPHIKRPSRNVSPSAVDSPQAATPQVTSQFESPQAATPQGPEVTQRASPE